MSVSKIEEKALLELTQYFDSHWQVVDVGANKGVWSDILINRRDSSTEAGKYHIRMIEPNDILRTYLQVKYDQNDKIEYRSFAISNETGVVDFWYWENKNNGLSSTLRNIKWQDELGEYRKYKIVNSISLDDLLLSSLVDIIKIDIEGAEWLAIQGAKRSLQEKRVKFFQVEYSEHYQIIDAKFKDIIKFANQFGYQAYSYDGEYFIKQTEEAFVEDYRLENFYLTYKEIGRYHYMQPEGWNNEFRKNTEFLKGKVNFALEIGSYEGMTSNYICDCLLTKDGLSRLICVDPLEDYYLPDADEVTNAMFVGQYDRFIKNTKGQPIELQRKKSKDAFPLFREYRFDLVYCDANHGEEEVFFDACQSFRLLKKDGYLLLDDYEWREETKRGIDKFLKVYRSSIKVIVKDYQVLVQRIVQ